jgi:hypothetical protein
VIFLCAFSLLGFFLAPGGLGRHAWLLLGWFTGVNLLLLFAPESLQPRENLWIYIVLSQAPWFLFCLDLLFRGRVGRIVSQAPLRPWIAWPLFRLMSIGGVFAMYAGDLPFEFALRTAFSDAVTALGALALWAAYRPRNLWYRGVLLFWNAYGLIAAVAASAQLLWAHPDNPLGRPSLDIHGYFSGFPMEWIPFFWMPLAICIHAAIFFKLYSDVEPTPA